MCYKLSKLSIKNNKAKAFFDIVDMENVISITKEVVLVSTTKEYNLQLHIAFFIALVIKVYLFDKSS